MPTEKKIEAAANSQEFAEARTQFEKYRHLWPATAPYFRTPTYKPWQFPLPAYNAATLPQQAPYLEFSRRKLYVPHKAGFSSFVGWQVFCGEYLITTIFV